MEYRVHITYDGVLTEELGDRLLDQLIKQAAGLGPVLSFDLERRTFTVTVATESYGVETALGTVVLTIGNALTLAGVSRPAMAAEVELVRAAAPATV